jgi:dTMP kinase
MTKKGFFITFEGGDRSGKSTQAKYLADKLLKLKYDIVKTREPGGTSLAEEQRNILLHSNTKFDALTEAYIFASARSSHTEYLNELMKENKIIVCDRFVHSSLAYQGVMRGLGIEFVKEINEKALRGLNPDLTFLIEISGEEFLKRTNNSEIDRIEQDSMKLENFHKLNDAYRKIAELENNFIIINGDGEENDIHEEILEITLNKLEEKGYSKTLK